jgi:hypothetical protein
MFLVTNQCTPQPLGCMRCESILTITPVTAQLPSLVRGKIMLFLVIFWFQLFWAPWAFSWPKPPIKSAPESGRTKLPIESGYGNYKSTFPRHYFRLSRKICLQAMNRTTPYSLVTVRHSSNLKARNLPTRIRCSRKIHSQTRLLSPSRRCDKDTLR